MRLLGPVHVRVRQGQQCRLRVDVPGVQRAANVDGYCAFYAEHLERLAQVFGDHDGPMRERLWICQNIEQTTSREKSMQNAACVL